MTTLPETAARIVQLHPATLTDARRIWEWRNEPATRAASFNTDEVPWDVHERWFAARLANPAARMFIAADGAGRQLGFVRFDLGGPGGRDAEISIALDVSTRGQGWGRAVIRASSEDLLRAGAADRVIARVKDGNPASLSAFTAAGFVVQSAGPRDGADSWTLRFDREPETRQ